MELTKEELLEQLSFLDAEKLNRLLFYASNIMIPDEDLLVDVTMKQMMEKAFEYADVYFPQWTDRGVADFGRFLVELVAIFSEKDFYYVNGYANENLLSKMSIYSDAFMRVVELGYYPEVSRSAKAPFNVTFPPSPDDYEIPRNGLIIKTLSGLFFTNLEPINVPSSATADFITVELNEGTILSENFQYDGFFVFVSKENVDTETLTVEINDTLYNRVRTFGRSLNSSKHFVAIPEDNGSIGVYFGDNIYGSRPALNSTVKVSYLQCSNEEGNITVEEVTVNRSPSERSATTAVMLEASKGGNNPDTLSDLKNNGRNFFASQFTLNNVNAVNRWLASQYDVKKYYVKIIQNNVTYKVIPTEIGAEELVVLNSLRDRMQPIINGGYYAIPSTTEFVEINQVGMQIALSSDADSALTKQRVINLIIDYTNPYTLGNYGKDFSKEELNILIRSQIPSVQAVIFTSINGSLDDIVVPSDKIMSKVEEENVNVVIVG